MSLNANVFNPFGFSHIEKIGGKPRQYSRQFPIAATTGGTGYAQSLFSGDPVAMITSQGGNYIGQATIPATNNTQPLMGIFNSVTYIDVNKNQQPTLMWIGGTLVLPGTLPSAIIDFDPGSVFQVQCNANFGFTNSLQTAIGRSFGFQYGAGNTNTKSSTATLDVAGGSQSANAFAPFKIVGLSVSGTLINNSWMAPYPIVDVEINNHFLKAGTIGI